MRKLKLSELNLGSAEVLTREQLKKILGGGTDPTNTIVCTCTAENGFQTSTSYQESCIEDPTTWCMTYHPCLSGESESGQCITS